MRMSCGRIIFDKVDLYNRKEEFRFDFEFFAFKTLLDRGEFNLCREE